MCCDPNQLHKFKTTIVLIKLYKTERLINYTCAIILFEFLKYSLFEDNKSKLFIFCLNFVIYYVKVLYYMSGHEIYSKQRKL